jgi:hypothetical protein
MRKMIISSALGFLVSATVASAQAPQTGRVTPEYPKAGSPASVGVVPDTTNTSPISPTAPTNPQPPSNLPGSSGSSSGSAGTSGPHNPSTPDGAAQD